jgi:hypothetical protein
MQRKISAMEGQLKQGWVERNREVNMDTTGLAIAISLLHALHDRLMRALQVS